MLDNLLLDIACPHCSYLFAVAYMDILLQRTVICHNCKTNVNLIDKDASVHMANKQMENLVTDLNNVFKKFK